MMSNIKLGHKERESHMSTEISNQEPLSCAAQPDWFLQSLVNLANNSDVEIGITLQVSGLLVSGTLVGGKKYFEGFAEDFSSAFANDPESAESIKSSFTKYGEIYQKEESEEVPPPQYIHMKDTHFFSTAGNPIPGNRGVWWRGRVAEVGGFILGSLS